MLYGYSEVWLPFVVSAAGQDVHDAGRTCVRADLLQTHHHRGSG